MFLQFKTILPFPAMISLLVIVWTVNTKIQSIFTCGTTNCAHQKKYANSYFKKLVSSYFLSKPSKYFTVVLQDKMFLPVEHRSWNKVFKISSKIWTSHPPHIGQFCKKKCATMRDIILYCIKYNFFLCFTHDSYTLLNKYTVATYFWNYCIFAKPLK